MGEGKGYLVWALSLYLEHPDPEQLSSESLTDNSDEKKIDFIRLDLDSKRIIVAQGDYSTKTVDAAPSNKASDLNTASAWLVSGNLEKNASPLRNIIRDSRKAIEEGEIDQIDLLFVHNLSESVNVSKELATAYTY